MRHQTLREIAKIATGLVVADIVSTLWFASAGVLPMTLLGVKWTAAMIPEVLVFDIALLMLLVHYGWNMKLPISSPSERTLLWVAGIIFLIVAVAHLMRLMFNMDLILGDFDVPEWVSWVGILITAYLSYASFHFARHTRGH